MINHGLAVGGVAWRGVLRQMPLTTFDELIARAAAADAALRDPPRLVETRYRAVLTGESLSGSAAWTVLHRRATPGLLSLDPLNLAVRKAAWEDGTAALFGAQARPASCCAASARSWLPA